MKGSARPERLGIGIIGSGFNAKFHLQGFVGVRDADILGVWSPNSRNAAAAAALSRKLGVGEAKAYKSIGDMVADPAIHAIWICGPNHKRVENMEEIVEDAAPSWGSPARSHSRATWRRPSG